MGKQPEYKKNNLLDASATFNQNQVCLTVVNKSEMESLKISIPIHTKIIETYLVDGDSPTDMNDIKNLEKVYIKKNKLEYCTEFINLPPHSFNLILLEI
jgi:alpha-L-arabinofuranosidase